MPVLFTKSGFHGNSLAALGPAPGDDRASALGLHTGAKAVRLRAVTTVRLECAFRHEKSCAPDVSNWIRSCDGGMERINDDGQGVNRGPGARRPWLGASG